MYIICFIVFPLKSNKILKYGKIHSLLASHFQFTLRAFMYLYVKCHFCWIALTINVSYIYISCIPFHIWNTEYLYKFQHVKTIRINPFTLVYFLRVLLAELNTQTCTHFVYESHAYIFYLICIFGLSNINYIRSWASHICNWQTNQI